MGSVYEEITRLETAKTDIETAIEGCGVNVPDTKLISDYAQYIRQIPSAVFSELNVDSIGGEDLYIKSIKQENGLINATTGGVVSSTSSGLAPKIITDAASIIAAQANEWVLTSTNGESPTWRKLPINAFTNYYRPISVDGISILGNNNTELDLVAGTNISITAEKSPDYTCKVIITNTGVRSVKTGTANGTISVNTNGTTANVAVKGLGSNAYTSTAYLPLSGGTMTGNIEWANDTGNASRFPSHIYRNTYDAYGNVYDHYYSSGITASQSAANLRVKNGNSYKTLVFKGDGTFQWDGKDIIHSGNISSQSVNYATSSGTASKIGNYSIWVGSRSEYGNAPYDANTIYFITD